MKNKNHDSVLVEQILEQVFSQNLWLCKGKPTANAVPTSTIYFRLYDNCVDILTNRMYYVIDITPGALRWREYIAQEALEELEKRIAALEELEKRIAALEEKLNGQ